VLDLSMRLDARRGSANDFFLRNMKNLEKKGPYAGTLDKDKSKFRVNVRSRGRWGPCGADFAVALATVNGAEKLE
jgi:hypothetical protein